MADEAKEMIATKKVAKKKVAKKRAAVTPVVLTARDTERTLRAQKPSVQAYRERDLARRNPVVRDIIAERDRLRAEVARLKKAK